MRGNPLSRATSVDGRWAYTLYDGGGAQPFVHALDTANATARCIDLDGLALGSSRGSRLSMADDGRVVHVNDGRNSLLAMSTQTFAVSRLGQRPRSTPWLGIGLAARDRGGRGRACYGCAAAARRTRQFPWINFRRGSRRRRLVCARRFFSSSRRSCEAFVGFVARRGRRTVVASRSWSRIRSVASPRFRSCERSSCAIARTTGPSAARTVAALARSARSSLRRRTMPRPASSSSERAGHQARSSART